MTHWPVSRRLSRKRSGDAPSIRGRAASHLAALGVVAAVAGASACRADTLVTIQFGGLSRTFQLHVPADYEPFFSYPIMLAEVGKNGSAGSLMHETGFDALADQYGFFVAYPNTIAGLWVTSGSNNDIQFNQAILSYLEGIYSIDSSRIYMSGYADGGRLAMTYACTPTPGSMLAGVAIVSNDMNTVDEPICAGQPQTPTAFLLFHGTADKASPYNGGGGGQGTMNYSAPRTASFWASLDGCTDTPASSQFNDELSNGVATTDVEQSWTACANGVNVSFYTINGGGHNWPGSITHIQDIIPRTGPTSMDLEASTIIWQTLNPFSVSSNCAHHHHHGDDDGQQHCHCSPH